VVDVERGQDLGRISHLGRRPEAPGEEPPACFIVRRANESDLKVEQQNRDREPEAARIARQKILDHHLEMKLVDVEVQWDGRKMTFYFTADGRVDFRELVKDLAATFRTRIDLRQIGARDETKRRGGYGVCGEPLCCGSFLGQFQPITTQMPRDQYLPLNPAKLSGVCSRLKCCLRYELDVYREFQKRCPKVGHALRDDAKGEGEIEKVDLVRGVLHIRYVGGDTEKVTPEAFAEMSDWKPEMTKADRITIAGRKAPPLPPPVEAKPEPVPPHPGRGERVTLLADGGLELKLEQGGKEVRVGADLEVVKAEQPKKKRRRRRGRKRGSPGGDTAGASPSEAGAQKSKNAG